MVSDLVVSIFHFAVEKGVAGGQGLFDFSVSNLTFFWEVFSFSIIYICNMSNASICIDPVNIFIFRTKSSTYFSIYYFQLIFCSFLTIYIPLNNAIFQKDPFENKSPLPKNSYLFLPTGGLKKTKLYCI